MAETKIIEIIIFVHVSINFRKNLQDANGIGRSSTLSPTSNTYNLVTRLDKTITFPKIDTKLNPFFYISCPIVKTVLWKEKQLTALHKGSRDALVIVYRTRTKKIRTPFFPSYLSWKFFDSKKFAKTFIFVVSVLRKLFLSKRNSC